MSILLIIGLVVLAVLALGVITTSLRRRDTDGVFGQLSGEAVKRDRGAADLADATVVASSAKTSAGRELEAVARKTRGIEPAAPAAPVAYVPPDPETLGVARRQFLNRGIVAMFGFGLSGFGAAVIGFLWPQGSSGFGSKINVGRIPDIEDAIAAGSGFFYVPEGRMWITEYPPFAVEKAAGAYGFYDQVEAGLKSGVTALYQTCPHLGCRVPECTTSQWFECPCHGSQYNRVGEKKGGPAPRGMDRFPMEVSASGELIVDTATIIQGPPIGTNTTGQEAEGPNCVGAAEGH
ncbi:MAG: ubiquinol-cytochrome c reductase iron-sulfur subunit [Acidimicrobiales bacterium]